MLKKDDEEWLREKYPGLLSAEAGVAGVIKFNASYDTGSSQFSLIAENVTDDTTGLILAGEFKVRIEERTAKIHSALPALYLEDIEPTADRHFGWDKSACLCSPLEEDEFLTPDLQFRLFIEQLVIPFLYGQLFYSINQRWPWSEYAHYATGLLESYGRYPDSTKAERILQALAQYRDIWPAIRIALLQRDYIKGHTLCFCERKDQLRRCHPGALKGIRQLHHDILELKIAIP
jgi:hypothetical protein